MDTAKKMMEKWGWKKGQGIGKDNKGMTSCLVLRKQDGSSTQGRIEQAAPAVHSAQASTATSGGAAASSATVAATAAADSSGALPDSADAIRSALHRGAAASMATSGGAAASAMAGSRSGGGASEALAPAAEAEEAAKRRRRSKWSGEDTGAAAQGEAAASSEAGATRTPERRPGETDATMSVASAAAALAIAVPSTSGLYDIDPRDGAGLYDIDPRDVLATPCPQLAAQQRPQGMVQFPNLVALGNQLQQQQQQQQPQQTEPEIPGLAQPKPRVRIRQFVRDDWRWSKGTEALRYFEEVQLASSLLEMARKILGSGSRYPARISDDTDCVTEVTAWGTLLVRPRGTGANVSLAKRMLYEVLHPSGGSLREDALITPDEMAEAAVRDQSTIAAGAEDDEKGEKLTVGVKRSAHGDLRRVGLGAEQEAMNEAKGEVKSAAKEVELATAEDARLVAKHLDDLRIASGAIPILTGAVLKVLGKDKSVKKAMQLVNTLIETGEWVALTEGFVMSEETKEKRRASEGPSEQILIKIPQGPVTQKIEKHLKSMERAAAADQLKLTSKAVAGKRTLMVDGTKAAHERVKLMVKELSEKGVSPMLTKALGLARGGARALHTTSALSPAPPPTAAKEVPTVSVMLAPGVVSAPPVLIERGGDDPGASNGGSAGAAATAATPSGAKAGLGPGPAMRYLPKPRLAADMAKGEDLFAGLPLAAAELWANAAATARIQVPDDPDVSVPQGAVHEAPTAPTMLLPLHISGDAMAAAEQELLQLAAAGGDCGAAVGEAPSGITE